MKKVKLHDKQFRLFIESENITSKIKDLAEVINHDFLDKKPIFLCVLNGSFLFASELIKRFNLMLQEFESNKEFINSSNKIKENTWKKIKKL